VIEPIYDYSEMHLEDIERIVILHRLEHYLGDKEVTARSLGVSPRTIYNKLEEYEKLKAAQKEAEVKREADQKEWLRRQRGEVQTTDSMMIGETSEPMKSPKVLKPGEMSVPVISQPVIPPPVVQLPPVQPARRPGRPKKEVHA
jgi:hypothetical protein